MNSMNVVECMFPLPHITFTRSLQKKDCPEKGIESGRLRGRSVDLLVGVVE